MRTRTRARAIATVVVLTALVTAAYGDLAATRHDTPGTRARATAAQRTPASGTNDGSGSAHINIVPPGPISLSAPVGLGVTSMIDVEMVGSGSDHLVQAQITGDTTSVVALTDTGCTPHQCSFTGGRTLPTTLGVSCTPDAQTRTVTLVVTGDLAGDMDTVTIVCGDDAPRLAVSPTVITAADTDVGSASGPYQFTVANAGSGSLTVGPMAFTSPEWTSGDPCVAAPCTLIGGSPQTINVTFTPTAWGNRNASVTIPSSNGMATVQLEGTGLGAVLDVIAPSAAESYTIDFGTIAKGAPSMRPLTLQTTGNKQLTAAFSAPLPPPFSLSQGSLTLDVGLPGSVAVICNSATALPEQTTTIAITSGAYASTPMPAEVTVKCAVADTSLQVSPQVFDFGELPLGSAAVTIPITLTNPSSAPMMLTAFKVVATSGVLTLTPPNQTLTLAANGGTATAMLVLDPTEVADVDGSHLDIKVDGIALSYPVTGRVVQAHAHLTPRTLDLGTACVGTPVEGTVTMVNDGTQTLLVQPPTMDQAFTAFPISPLSYPPAGATLAPGKSAMAGVRPAASTPGLLSGTLTWDVNAPEAPFEIPVTLEYIAEGTAVSPSELAFGTQTINVASNQQTVTLENCNLDPADVEVRGVVSQMGAVSAWKVDPRTLQTTLGSHGKQMITVAFEPPEPGHYAARIELFVAGEPRTILLTGDAAGDRVDRTSFYACSCSGPGAPAHGWPIIVAVACVLAPWRRRRR